MMLRTGTSKTGHVYGYYTCASSRTKGNTVCKGRSLPMQKLDTLVTEHLMERLFKPERVATILASLSSRRVEMAAALNSRLMSLQREMTDADDKLKRLYQLVEDGLTDLDEVLKDRLNTLKAERQKAKAALDRARECRPLTSRSIWPRSNGSAEPCGKTSAPARSPSGRPISAL
jgi:site-specific DNA recombinase